MISRIPPLIPEKDKICIICEGSEEYEYLERLISLDVWNERYKIELDNADGNGNIPARYQDRYQNGSYDLVLIFCDTDKKPYEQYSEIKEKINSFHGLENAADEVIIFGNPCTMQIIILHMMQCKLSSPAKKQNSPLIDKCFGIEGYKAKKEQRDNLFSKINKENYCDMKERIKELSADDAVEGSTNFLKFINNFSSASDKWIYEINGLLESE